MSRTSALLLGLLLASGCATSPQRAALKSADAFVRQLRSERVHVDDYWLLTLARPHRPDWASAPLFARTAQERFPGDPYLRFLRRDHQAEGLTFERLAKGEQGWPYRVPEPYAGMLYTPFDKVLLRALYCDYGTYGKEDLDILKSVELGDGSYADTHALVALLLVAEQKPELAALARPEIAALAPILVAAQDQAERFDDLFAERIVFLYWAGRGDLVKPAWLERTVKAQRPDGAWGSEAGKKPNLHTTALAILSLLYAAEGRPQQPLYAP
jgi:hypothetical protein